MYATAKRETSLRGNHHGLCYTLGSTPDGGGEKRRERRATTLNSFSLLLYLAPLPFSVLQAQAVEVFPKQRLGTNSVNV